MHFYPRLGQWWVIVCSSHRLNKKSSSHGDRDMQACLVLRATLLPFRHHGWPVESPSYLGHTFLREISALVIYTSQSYVCVFALQAAHLLIHIVLCCFANTGNSMHRLLCQPLGALLAQSFGLIFTKVLLLRRPSVNSTCGRQVPIFFLSQHSSRHP
jgi:hypothetical protein